MHQAGNVNGSAARATQPRAPKLLVELPSRRQVFLSNLGETLRRSQPSPAFHVAEFWPDVFVPTGVPWRRIIGSTLYQLILVGVAVGLTQLWMAPAPRVRTAFDTSSLVYYKVSEYLPPVNTGAAPTRRKPQSGAPAYASQEIASLPPLHDNTHQTIITPDPTKLSSDVPLPNLVANAAMPGPAPAEAITDTMKAPQFAFNPVAPPPDATRATSKLVLPTLPVDAIAPPPDVLHAQERTAARGMQESAVAPPPQLNRRARVQTPTLGEVKVIEPPPAIEAARSRARLPILAAPSVITPPVDAGAVRNVGAVNIARMEAKVAAPPAPMMIRRGAGSSGRASQPVSAPSPASVAGGNGSKAMGQVIALSVHPAMPNGLITVPAGSRYGEFAAGPTGKPDAPGTPEIKATSGTETTGASGNALHNAPPGISVGAGATQPAAAVVVATTAPPPPISTPTPSARPFMKTAMPTRVADLARQTRPGAPPSAPSEIEGKVFGTKKYYTMQLNMPNLSSQSGSWVIRFAELRDAGAGDVTAPVVTQKVDPNYPADAIRDRIEGTVILYAVIHKDGTVGEVRVLHGVDARLDENACAALTRWRFMPGTKNGSAVDLEAVVQIPFQARRLGF